MVNFVPLKLGYAVGKSEVEWHPLRHAQQTEDVQDVPASSPPRGVCSLFTSQSQRLKRVL